MIPSAGILTWVSLLFFCSIAVGLGAEFGLGLCDNSGLFGLLLFVLLLTAVGNLYTTHNARMAAGEEIDATIDATTRGESCLDDSCTYFVAVEYQYSYDGSEYTAADRTYFETAYDASKWQERNSAGDSISVFVVPDNPSVSFIEKRGFAASNFWRIVIGSFLLFLLGGWILALVEKRIYPRLDILVARKVGQ